MPKQIHPVHFEDFSGHQFERLCFAHLLRRYPSARLDWYGQLGSDRGRDIVCTEPDGSVRIYQCANVRRLPLTKVHDDLAKIAGGPIALPAHFCLIAGGLISGQQKDKITRAAVRVGFCSAEVISGPEFEEHLRIHTPELLRRFVEGVTFPELPAELAVVSQGAADLSDQQITEALTLAFDRPAFRTHFHQESSLPRFKEALAETIRTLNTGLTPEGVQLPSRHHVRDPATRATLDRLVGLLVGLRSAFDECLRRRSVRPCGCGVPDCPVFMVEPEAAADLDHRRREILRLVHTLNGRFVPEFY
jgi:hypothetical protein